MNKAIGEGSEPAAADLALVAEWFDVREAAGAERRQEPVQDVLFGEVA